MENGLKYAMEDKSQQEYTNAAFESEDSNVSISSKDFNDTKRWSVVLRQVIELQDDDDLHPYGRGGIYRNIIYGRRMNTNYDSSKMFIWLVFVGFLILGAVAIIFVAEMYYASQREEQSQKHNTTAVG